MAHVHAIERDPHPQPGERALTVLSVASPLAPVGPDSIGGAEQVLAALDEALVDSGHRSLVIACSGSTVRGELIAIPRAVEPLTEAAYWAAHAACRRGPGGW